MALTMLSVSPICSISTRPAYFGTRRIAPAAATSRSKAWGARPAVEELRPAHRTAAQPRDPFASPARLPVAAFVAHVIGQFEPNDADGAMVVRAYDAADALGYELPAVVVATL